MQCMSGNPNQRRSNTRERLAKLLREGGSVLTVESTARILTIDTDAAAKTLARWNKSGWLSRVKRGVYVPVPIESINNESALEDAWIVIPELFGPAYVGGWSAAEYWDLTEQIFRDICVFTSRTVPRRHQTFHNVPFVVTHIAENLMFGTKTVWIREKKLLVSDASRTVVDMLASPWVGGGIEHAVDCFQQYIKSSQFQVLQLVEYAERLSNAAIFKRLGFLAERMLGENHELVAQCKSRLSKGNAQLAPNLKGDKLVTRWRLFVPSSLPIATELPK